MTFKEDLLADESIIFDADDLAKPMKIRTLKGFIKDDCLAIFKEDNTNLVLNEGLETNNSSALIKIPRSVFNEASKNESIVRGWIITNKEEKKEWEVQQIVGKPQGLYVDLLCMRSIFSKAKA